MFNFTRGEPQPITGPAPAQLSSSSLATGQGGINIIPAEQIVYGGSILILQFKMIVKIEARYFQLTIFPILDTKAS